MHERRGTQVVDRRAPKATPVSRWPTTIALGVLALGVALTLVTALRSGSASGNMHALQADALIHGHLDLATSVEDVAPYGGRVNSPYPPAPAILLIPVVALVGLRGPTTILVAVVLTALAVALARRICRTGGLSDRDTAWLLGGTFLGTGVWWCVLESDTVWMFSHVVAFVFLLGSIDRAMRRRAVSAGLLLGCAFLSRQLSVFAAPFVLALLVDGRPRREQARDVARALIPLGILTAVYAAFNAARFSGPTDTGYGYIPLGDFLAQRVADHGLWSFAYLPFNATYLLLQGPHLNFTGPDMLGNGGMDAFGTAVTFASPFLLFAVIARPRRLIAASAALSIGLILLGHLTYYNNGYAQANTQRFSLDWLPIAFVLLVWAIPRARTGLWRGAVAYSIGLNFLALVVIPRV